MTTNMLMLDISRLPIVNSNNEGRLHCRYVMTSAAQLVNHTTSVQPNLQSTAGLTFLTQWKMRKHKWLNMFINLLDSYETATTYGLTSPMSFCQPICRRKTLNNQMGEDPVQSSVWVGLTNTSLLMNDTTNACQQLTAALMA
jgi:hypothetical protein